MFEFLKSKEQRLSEARTRLEENLETKGVHYIIDIMASNKIYSPLLKKSEKRKSVALMMNHGMVTEEPKN